ncbi:MAG TPA: adenine phosphoribosyltransferase [Spirochaetia bacterium]|nr:MAG: adenine phosphoribosyltransferase [Spirochaetes bacterium GWB1_36_13]HCL56112.1 adenine phosphoribosyltransferase [Spirochaetia bacterium]
MDLKKMIRDLPDYPVKGVVFKDLTTLLKDKEAFRKALDEMLKQLEGMKIDKVIGIEARGFIFGSQLAYAKNAGFVPVRKKNKLPWKTYSAEYELEYGKDRIEIHQDAVESGEKVLIVDDLLATGGTTKAVVELLGNFKNIEIIGASYLVELGFLKGREKLNIPVFSLLQY